MKVDSKTPGSRLIGVLDMSGLKEERHHGSVWVATKRPLHAICVIQHIENL
jgi:hypothetical protein